MLLLKRRVVSAITFAILLVGMFRVAFSIQAVKADGGTIYIRADGSIDPPTAPVFSADNITYTLTDNFTAGVDVDGIVVQRDNIVVDGAGYTLQAPTPSVSSQPTGTDVTGRSNVTIKNMTIKGFIRGIALDSSSGSTIAGNNVTTNWEGIKLVNSSTNSISGNYITIAGYPIWLFNSSSNSISGNNITRCGGEAIFLEYSSDYNTISGNDATDNGDGIRIDHSSSYNTISGNNVTGGGGDGVFLGDSSTFSNISENNIIANTASGMYFDSYSDNNTVSGNNITSNGNGIEIYASSFNSISGNNVTANNFDGINLGVSSSYNSISGNNVTNNKNNGIIIGSYSNHNNNVSGNNVANNGDGISVWLSSGNSIIGNKFINNGIFVQPSSYPPNSVENNTVNGRPLVYLENVSNYIIVDAGQVVLVRCFNITVEDLNLSGTDAGIELWQTDNSTISGNNITENKLGGIFLIGSSGNSIYHNSFINNTIQVYIDSGYPNTWDNGYPSGGNYWSDYNGTDIRSGPYQNETGSDGIGDTPYVIDMTNKDRYPRGVFRLAGDLNGDGIVDILDAVQAASAFGSSPGHHNWNSQADLNNDGIIDIFDIIILAGNFEKPTGQQAGVMLYKANVIFYFDNVSSVKRIDVDIGNSGTTDTTITTLYIGLSASNLVNQTITPQSLVHGGIARITINYNWTTGTTYYFKVFSQQGQTINWPEQAPTTA